MSLVRPVLRALLSVYGLVPIIMVAASALSYYSYRYAEQMARRGEQSILDSTRDLAEEKITRIEHLIVASDQTLFNLIDPDNLAALPRRWSDIGRLSPAIESVIVLDAHEKIAPDGYLSKKRTKAEVDAFRRLFEVEILPDLKLDEMAEGDHRHLHQSYGGRPYLLSYARRSAGGRRFTVVLEVDLAYIVGEVFPEYFAGVELRRLYQVVDENDNLVFGHPVTSIPARYVVTVPFPTTLWAWRLRMAPREAPILEAREARRRRLDLVLIALSAGTIFVGIGVLTVAVRGERRLSRLKSDFIANVSHELKTPLSLISMFAEMIATGRTKGPEKTKEYGEIISREGERLSHLIDNVLDFARIERGRAAYRMERGDLAEVVARALDVCRHRLDHEGITLTTAIAEDLPPVRLDENAMTLLLLNLIDNAVKYGGAKNSIEVGVRGEGARVVLEVSDHGPGIGADEQERIFDRFYRSRTVRDLRVRGSGIGLSLVKHIAEAHGGGVKVRSALGEGSTFSVWLPRAGEVE